MKNLKYFEKEKPSQNLVFFLHFILIQISLLVLFVMLLAGIGNAQNAETINNINNGMPNRISMNVTVAKQTQGATFGEKVHAGLQTTGSAVAQGASLLGAALPGGSILSAALSKTNSEDKEWEVRNQGNGFTLPENLEPGEYILTIVVSNGAGTSDVLKTKIRLGILTSDKGSTAVVSSVSGIAGGTGGGAAAAGYAATGRTAVVQGKMAGNQPSLSDTENARELSGSENLYSIYINGVEYAMLKGKARHDTVKNSINNIR
jgi:hypothetical protein